MQLDNNEFYLRSSENKAWKNSDLYGIWTHDLHDTGAALYQQSWQANWEHYLSSSENKQPVRFRQGKTKGQ